MPIASAAPLESALGATASGTFSGGQRTSRGALIAGAVGIAVIGAAAAFAFMPRKGSLVVSVAGPGGKVVDSVQIYVDSTKRCDASPCQVAELSRGVHFIKCTAKGYQATAPKAVKVQAGEEAAENASLVRGGDGTGIKVIAEGAGLKLSVDGKDFGPLPQEVKDLEPGTHTVRIDGGVVSAGQCLPCPCAWVLRTARWATGCRTRTATLAPSCVVSSNVSGFTASVGTSISTALW